MKLLYGGNVWACCMCFRARQSEYITRWVDVVIQSDCASVCMCSSSITATAAESPEEGASFFCKTKKPQCAVCFTFMVNLTLSASLLIDHSVAYASLL